MRRLDRLALALAVIAPVVPTTTMVLRRLPVLAVVVGALGCRDAAPSAPSTALAPAADAGGAVVLSAFFGLDNALPRLVELICPGGGGRDGMPVTFSRRVVGSPSPDAFRITTRSGAAHRPACATLAPATGERERHTVLLGGDLGDEPGDPPVRVEIVASLALEGGLDARGLAADVTPLAAGPSVVLALRYAPAALQGTACPSPATRQIVQITWNGGVTAPDGSPVGDAQRRRIHVEVSRDGGAVEVTPTALADLGDNDNYLHLCLDTDAPPAAVRVEAGAFVDPRGDLNAETRAAVVEGG
jgi:hypothetical protein